MKQKDTSYAEWHGFLPGSQCDAELTARCQQLGREACQAPKHLKMEPSTSVYYEERAVCYLAGPA